MAVDVRCVCPCHTHSGTYPPPCNARGLGCTAYTLAHLARALGVSADWLFWGDEYAGNREEAQAS